MPEDRHEGEQDFGAQTKRLLQEHGESLLHLAGGSIAYGLAHDTVQPVEVEVHPAALREQGACFVTLKRAGHLRGCIGSPQARRSLVQDVVENAYAAAFRDPRFPKLTSDEVENLQLSISVLSPQAPIAFSGEADLLARLRPRIDGLVIAEGMRRALFLPSVWEQLPDPKTFLGHLKLKAGMAANHFSDDFQAWRFVAEELHARNLDNPQSIWSHS